MPGDSPSSELFHGTITSDLGASLIAQNGHAECLTFQARRLTSDPRRFFLALVAFFRVYLGGFCAFLCRLFLFCNSVPSPR